ncbi:hypothetical protein GCM10007036_03950 [Alsobacter metallidurans]|uniref:Lysozyme inhibitor LprI N-terminal domain-containing protein n=1 Tax=Alsobacter metallidurans TaxID=340221 RepID=A0A917MG41_9HYPH|nr:hypothetical protein [Alsobacter metallidurans]GGH08455.1 hypothetical protein GCM10007036_03950 [Alsobacter metallidurans]
MSLRVLALAGACVAILAAPARAAGPNSPECKRDLLVADSLVRTSRDRLVAASGAPLANQCAVWREHVNAARQANAIQGRCQTGIGKSVIQAELVNTATEFEAQIKARCKGL